MNINALVMAELKKLKDDQQRLNEELLALKIQNMKLSSKIDNFGNEIQHTHPAPSPFLLSNIDQRPMVVFDLIKKPAIVLTANDAFCEMLGYEMVTFLLSQSSLFHSEKC
jgi:hypothetical protein